MLDEARCLDPEILGGYAEGKLEPMAREIVIRHLSGCDDCLMAVGDAVHAHNEAQAPPARQWRRFAVAAGIVVIAGVTALWTSRLWRVQPSGMDALIAAVPQARYRIVEPRLSGFGWTALRRTRTDDSALGDPDYLPVAGAAGDAVRRSRSDSSAEAAHAAGVAELLLRKPDDASARLRALTGPKATADVWNDLAAAYFTGAVQEKRDGNLPLALDASDRALALDANHAPALFNRALILERLGLRDDARVAWERYLAVDATSGWAQEARAHIKALRGTPSSRRFEGLDAAAAAGDRAKVDAFVRSSPQDARGWYEAEQLGLWGESVLRGDTDASSKRLQAIRLVAASLEAHAGESMLRDAVTAIDAAPNLPTLAAAHARYRTARLAYRDLEFALAEQELRTAAEGFAKSGSPMEQVARFYAACTIFDQNRIDEAARLLVPLLRDAHPALHAQAALQLARCDQHLGRWRDAFAHFAEAAATFRRLGEQVNSAVAEGSFGDALHDVGRRDEAWRHRRAEFALLSAAGAPYRIVPALAAAARSELRDGRLEAARAVVRVEIEAAQRHGHALMIADAFRRQAVLEARLGDAVAARTSLASCRRHTAKASPSAMRDRLIAESGIAEAIVTAMDDPRSAVQPLTKTIDFFRAAGHRFSLPDALLERGRIHRINGNAALAQRDFAEGIEELERQRHDSGGVALEAFFDPSAPLFEEATASLLAAGDEEHAFEVADRARARALAGRLQSTPATPSALRPALHDRMTLVAFAPLPEGMAAFCVTRDGAAVIRLGVTPMQLEQKVHALRETVGRSAPLTEVRVQAAALHRLLIAPLALGNAHSLVIVAGRELQAAPWAALYDSERREWLVERYAITVAPSAGLWLHQSARLQARQGARLMLVAADTKQRLDALTFNEAAVLESLYPDRHVLRGNDATPSRFLAGAAQADVIHFTGHARAGAGGAEAALLMAPDARWPDGELYGSDVARSRLERTRLVTLGACSTIGRASDSLEAMPGLTAAFLAAGVPSVVGTLWAIDDGDAAALFGELHRRLREGAGTEAALRDAQLSMIRSNGPRSHPAAWAAVTLVGGSPPGHEERRR